ncbi:MAG TPA: efflux RND transporter periplasmic adaptor subunit [Drouetiella sp.]
MTATCLLLVSCTSTEQKTDEKSAESNKTDSETSSEKESVVSLPTQIVHRAEVTQAVTFPGKVNALPDCSISVSPNIAGKLVEVKVVPGQVVAKGQLIAKLDDRQLRAQLLTANAPQKTALNGVAQAKINLDLAQKNLARTEALFAKEIVAQKDLVAARSAMELAKSQVDAAQAKVMEAKTAPAQLLTQLSFMSVYTPLSGVVAHRYLNVGSSVDPTTPIVHIVNLSQVMVNANMPADSPAAARVGQTASITAVAEPGIIYHGQIKSVSPQVDPANNTVSIEVLAKNDGNLKEGQQVNVAVSTARVSAYLVPETAILPGHDDPSENYLFTVHDNKLKLTKVNLGTKSDTMMPVLSGLKDGDEIVTSGAYGVADGATLERQSEKDKPSAGQKSVAE